MAEKRKKKQEKKAGEKSKLKAASEGQKTEAAGGERRSEESEEEKELARSTGCTPEPCKLDFPIVCIGASAGGLEALEVFFASMPSDPEIAFVVITHLDPRTHSKMPELLQAKSRLRVQQIEDRMKAAPNQVYVIPSTSVLQFHEGEFVLTPRRKDSHGDVIDWFLNSIAGEAKENCAAVILSGTGSDGSKGIEAVKNEGGAVFAQSINSARFPGMPQSAIETGLVDFVLPPDKIPKKLVDYFSAAPAIARQRKLQGAEASALRLVLSTLRSLTGHDFSHYKKATILRRLERRMRLHQIGTIQQYARFLQEKPQEGEALFREILIGATSFFREPESFEVLKNEVLPELFGNKPEQYDARVWVAGVATGEEAYSMAIVLDEFIKESRLDISVQIFATDINAAAIDAARTGEYPSTIAHDVNEQRLKTYFTKHDNGYKVRHDIRDMVVFAAQDVNRDPPFINLDLLCCRNLLIYLGVDLQRRLIPLFHYSLRQGGVLFLGASETIGDYGDLFSIINSKWKIYRRREVDAGQLPHVEMPLTRQVKLGRAAVEEEPLLVRAQELERELLLQFAPPSVVVNRDGDIHYIHGRTGNYLEPAQGQASLNVLQMAREGLNNQLPILLASASQGKTVSRENVRVKYNGGYIRINVTVKPFGGQRKGGGLYIVMFEESAVEAEAKKRKKGKAVATSHVEELERDLADTRENLQTSIEELQTSNEELRSVNEEYQSTNEELQSTNEELETSREEMQSLNEELTTVNNELQRKIDELVQSNDHMKSFLDSLELPTLFLGPAMNIRRFTSQAKTLFNIVENDIGRPLSHFSNKLEYEGLLDDLQRIQESRRTLEKEVRSTAGRWYLMRMMPYRSEVESGGVVVTFIDIDQFIRRDLAQTTLELLPNPLVLVDKTGTVLYSNPAFSEVFHLEPDEAVHSNLFSLCGGAWAVPELQQFLAKTFGGGPGGGRMEFEQEFPGLGRRHVQVDAYFAKGKERLTSPILLNIKVSEEK